MKTMRKIGIIAFFVICALSLLAAPARRGWYPRTLADGTVVQVQQVGDEFYHFMVTQDGKMVTESAKGLVISDEPLPTPAQVAARRAQRAPQAAGVKNLAPRGLVVLAAFQDVPYEETNDNAGMWDMMNKSGYDYQGATGSARDYFIAQSDSAYMPVFDVVGPVTLPQNRAYYGANTTGDDGSDAHRREMVVDACRLVDDVVDFTLYDNDNNGQVDFVYIVYAGKGENDGGPAESIWAHNWSAASLNCRLDGKKLANYACSGEIDGPTGKRNGIGVICHEFGHVIGLPDYYDTKYSTNYLNWLTPNYWSTMDQGCYNNGAMTPPNYSIFDKYYFGWATPVILAKDEHHYVRMGTDCKNAYQITGGATLKPYTTTDTVYYIENRQQIGWDAALPSHGMIVWQVVYSQSAWTNNVPNNTAYQPRLTIVSAVPNSKIGAFDGSAANNPFPGVGNVTTYTPFAGCALTDITEENGMINFKYNGGKAVCEYMVMSENCTVSSEEGTLSAGETLTLTITPNAGYSLDPDCWIVEMGEVNPILEYGIDYTYDAQTGVFRLENVIDDVTVVVEAKEDAGTGMEREEIRVKSEKILKNGQLIIVRGNKQYNAQGTEIQ